MIDAFFSDHEGHAIRRLLAWEDAEDKANASEHFMRDRIGLPILQTFQKAVEQVSTLPMTLLELQMHALSLMGISMIFHLNQSRVMDMLNWPAFDDCLLSNLKAVARRQLSYALIGLSRDAASASLSDAVP